MHLRYHLPWFLCLICPLFIQAAVINGYARITGVSGTVLTVGNVDETAAQFVVGKSIILMQMQDDVIGGNTGNNSDFGNIDDLQQAGKYIVRTITAVTRNGSNVLTSITLNDVPDGSYHISANGSLQAITFELLGAGSAYTTTADITALNWNSSTGLGGVAAFHVNGALTLRHSISADGAGFLGGIRTTGGGAGCDASTYITSYPASAYASKGEGIYRMTNPAWASGRGKSANGGGGGNSHNAGGGGGGGFTAGGLGGAGYGCGTNAGGLGGAAIGPSVSMDRIFMGGGGGGGEGNNNVSTDGGRGGGIVIIQAQSITTSGNYSNLRISANGSNGANTSGNDGAGGGGAGGAVVLQVPSYAVAATAPITIRANGGSGGTVTDGASHGGGGGGGQGTVIFSTAQPTTNITSQTLNGAAGCNNNSNPCNSSAGTGTGTNGAGILSSYPTVLPIRLLWFHAAPAGGHVALTWSTASETDNELFRVERSLDLTDWANIAELPGAGNSASLLDYRAIDPAPAQGVNYYRLRQIDTDGTSTVSDMVAVHVRSAARLSAFPNPASDVLDVRLPNGGDGVLEVINDLGQHVVTGIQLRNGHGSVDVAALPNGGYVLMLRSEGAVRQERFLVQH